MNTKTDVISSGLVAVAWMNKLGDYFERSTPSTVYGSHTIPLVRLSDAEAIIAQKDAEILEQCRINGMGAEREDALLGKVAQQSAALKLARESLHAMHSLDEENHQRYSRDADICTEIRMCRETLAAIDSLKGE